MAIEIIKNYKGIDILKSSYKDTPFCARGSIWAMPTLLEVEQYIDTVLSNGTYIASGQKGLTRTEKPTAATVG